MKQIQLPCGESVAALGQGTWRIGDSARNRNDEVAALRHGIDAGMTLVDTAEMYGEGLSESVVGEAIRGRRDEVFVVTKVYPYNASRKQMPKSCDASLKRLGIDTIDLYLLHWPGDVPLAETVETFQSLQQAGKIRHWGVSNFDAPLMKSLWRIPGGDQCQVNQVLYHLEERGPEWDLLPWMRERGIGLMAYSPFDEGRLLKSRKLNTFAKKHGMTAAQAALAWLLAQDGVIAIPKTSHAARVDENVAAAKDSLSAAQFAELDALFPPPDAPRPLAMI